MKEIWKDIKGYEGQYQVSNLGRVKSLPRTTPYINKAGYESCQFREGQLKKEIDNGRGYKSVSLYKDNKGKQFYIHRLVADAFIENVNDLYNIAIKDKEFCDLDNLITYCKDCHYGKIHGYNLKADDKSCELLESLEHKSGD